LARFRPIRSPLAFDSRVLDASAIRTSTLISILFLGSAQLIGIGILGEYIGRIYDEVKRRLCSSSIAFTERPQSRHEH
jgi:hypothetical protein